MKKTALITVLVAACSGGSSKLDAPPASPPANLVCLRFTELNKDARCIPEMTDVGERHTHTALVSVKDNTLACTVDVLTVSMVCGLPVVFPHQQPEPQPEAEKPANPPKPAAKSKPQPKTDRPPV